jgi:hypothetical protein
MNKDMKFYMNNDRYQQVKAILGGLSNAFILTVPEKHEILTMIMDRIPKDIDIEGRRE